MASIHKRPGRRTWFAFFRANRRSYFPSTGIEHSPRDPSQVEINERKAKAKADQMEREKRASAPNQKLSTQEYLEAFAATRDSDPDAARRTRGVISRFLMILGELQKGPLTVVGREHILQFKASRENEVEPSTFNSELSALNTAFLAAVEKGLIPSNPVDMEADQILVTTSSVRSLQEWEVKALLLATMILDWRTCIYIGFYLGCQLVDAAYRRWSDLAKDEAGRTWLTLPENERRAAKKVLVHPVLVAHFASIPRVNEFICPTLANLERWTVDNHFANLVAAASLEKGVTFRCLRHTYARLIGWPMKRLDMAPPEALLVLPDIRVPGLACQTPVPAPAKQP